MGILLIVLRIVAAGWVYLDCRKRQATLLPTLVWTLAALVMPLVVVFYALFGRGKASVATVPPPPPRQDVIDVEAEIIHETQRCRRCGREGQVGNTCPACGNQLR